MGISYLVTIKASELNHKFQYLITSDIIELVLCR